MDASSGKKPPETFEALHDRIWSGSTNPPTMAQRREIALKLKVGISPEVFRDVRDFLLYAPGVEGWKLAAERYCWKTGGYRPPEGIQ